jgi:hypothetical protein
LGTESQLLNLFSILMPSLSLIYFQAILFYRISQNRLDESKLEFAFEGHRLFDLGRTGLAMTELQNIPRTNGPAVSLPEIGRAVFPIPNFELDANENIVQNEAYR